MLPVLRSALCFRVDDVLFPANEEISQRDIWLSRGSVSPSESSKARDESLFLHERIKELGLYVRIGLKERKITAQYSLALVVSP